MAVKSIVKLPLLPFFSYCCHLHTATTISSNATAAAFCSFCYHHHTATSLLVLLLQRLLIPLSAWKPCAKT